ncbi:MAG: S-adenosylmethionine:tRNA ribosyltransferase-isomerase, partial [Paludibacteraceae bacterium]|nr:S-adenosylmethionine:tRNA ribosyltransferase-isomerase [Paludibacteraceae bacterium]
MFDLDSIQEIWATITRNKARSIFTAFGVFWGMIMLMVLLGCGLGLERTMLSKWGDTSTNAAFFFQGTTSKPYKGFKKGRKVQFKMDDIDALRHKFSEIDKCSPIVWSSAKKVLYLDKSTTGINMMGLASDYNSINPCKLIEGRFLNHIDEVQSRKVCVIGSKVKNDLYGASDARGTIIWINGAAYTVIGVMEKMADINLFGSPEESIYVPYTTLAQTSNKGDKIDCISLAARKNVNIEDFQKDVASYLKEIHSVDPDDEQGIGMFNTKQFFDLFSMLLLGIRILIWNVGLGTFRPVSENDITKHDMHSEKYEITSDVCDKLNKYKEEKRRIICVGTTSLRTLEANITKYGKFTPTIEETSIFIYPPHEFKSADALITNFHLPKSTLVMLVSAFSSVDIIKNAYYHA